jgi:hypothetical protein
MAIEPTLQYILQQYFYERDWIPLVRQQAVKDSVKTAPGPHYRINTQPLGISKIAKPYGRIWVSSLWRIGVCIVGNDTGGRKNTIAYETSPHSWAQPHDIALVVIDRFQHNVGVRFPILEDTQRELPHLEGIWISTVWAYLANINGSLQIGKATIQSLQRQGDQYIMDVVLASRLFKPREIKFINYCRFYLQVLSLSNMYNAQGNALAVGIYDGYRSVSQSCSVLLEPLQARPSKVTWSLWRPFLRFLTADGCWVCEPLGPWYNSIYTRCQWPSYFALSHDMLYQYSCEELVSHQRIGPIYFSEKRTTYEPQHLPSDAIPVYVTDINVGWYMFDTNLPAPIEMHLVAFPAFGEYLQSLPEHESLLL